MPKNRMQETIFTIMMVFVMVYAMICYNISIANGAVESFVFLAAFQELPIMMLVGFLLDTLIAGPLAKKQAFRVVTPGKSKPISVVMAISVFSILLMCPLMSFFAVILFKGGLNDGLFICWIRTVLINLPMAFFWQIFIAGPLVRNVFRKLFPEREKSKELA